MVIAPISLLNFTILGVTPVPVTPPIPETIKTISLPVRKLSSSPKELRETCSSLTGLTFPPDLVAR